MRLLSHAALPGFIAIAMLHAAMEPLGHVAGIAASAQGFVTTVGGALLGFLIGQSCNGTDVPLCLGFAACGVTTLLIVLVTENGKLFSRPAMLLKQPS